MILKSTLMEGQSEYNFLMKIRKDFSFNFVFIALKFIKQRISASLTFIVTCSPLS